MTLEEHCLKQILTDTNELHGWSIPNYVVDYEAKIFASKLAKPTWRPEPSYAEQYLRIQSREQALAFANVCWFTRAVFPELGERRGITMKYYTDLGQSCYDHVIRSSSVSSPTLTAMRDHFDFLAETAYTAFRHYGDFRSMWD